MDAHASTPFLPAILAVAFVFAGIHLLADRLRFLDGTPRSRWLSAAGGVSVAYVFLHVLPELGLLAREHGAGGHGSGANGGTGNQLVWITALGGLVTAYVAMHLLRQRAGEPHEDAPDGVFALHLTSFALYNLLIGCLLLRREDADPVSLATYAFAMGLHFITNDWGLRHAHPRPYHRWGRFVLAGAVLAGVAIGLLAPPPAQVTAYLFAFLAGGVVLNVLKEELPEERESRSLPFVGAALGYGALLLVAH